MASPATRAVGRLVAGTAAAMAVAVSGNAALGQTIHVDAAAGHATNTITPPQALGAGIDRLPHGASDKLLTDGWALPISKRSWIERESGRRPRIRSIGLD